MKIPRKLICSLLLILLFSHPAYAEDIFVAKDGSGDYISIKEALNKAKDGDTIYVKPGEYKESLRIKKNNLTLKGAGFTRTKLIAEESFPIKLKGVRGFTLEGFFIKALTNQGFSSVLISDVTAVIRHCLITSGPDGYGIFCNKKTKATIEHNTIVGNKKDGGIRLDKSCVLTIKNNIIVNNGSGIHNKDKTGMVGIYHNNVWGNGKDYVNCRPVGGNISVDPLFVNPDVEDYQLSSSSPCLKAGENGVDIGPKERIKLVQQKKEAPTPAIKPKPKPEPTPGEEEAPGVKPDIASPKVASVDDMQEIQIEADKRQEISVQPKEEFGHLELNSQPQGAMVYIDGEFKGETPLTISDLSIGFNQLKLIKYTPEAILRHEAQVTINLGANQLNIAQLERVIPPADMVFIPGSDFEMGGMQGKSNEQPLHQVYLDNFYIDKYEVSNARYNEFVQATGNKPPTLWGDENFNQPKQPVVGVSWQDAGNYCKWAGKRLPSEAEWEKTARGTNGHLYPWGDEFVYGQANIIVPGDGYRYTAPVGSYPDSVGPYGALDMAGNAAEWCADWYASDYYANSPDAEPQGLTSGEYRIVRGGSWNSPGYDVRSTSRWRYYPDTPRSYIGFRCVWQP